MEQPPRDMVALAVLLADLVGGHTKINLLNGEGQRNTVAAAFEMADEYLKQARGEKQHEH